MVPQADQVWHSTSILYIQHSTQLSLDAVPQRYPGSHLSDELAGVRQVFGQTTSRRLGSAKRKKKKGVSLEGLP